MSRIGKVLGASFKGSHLDKLAVLTLQRRHIKQKHSGPGILAQPYCSTCKAEFLNATLLDEHARRGDCLYRGLPSSIDPLDGLTPEAERALRSKQGRQGDTALNQYRQICKIVLGEHTEVLSSGKSLLCLSLLSLHSVLGCPDPD
jgi:hypothetical protein